MLARHRHRIPGRNGNFMYLGEVVGCIVRITPNIGELCNLLAFLKAWSTTILVRLGETYTSLMDTTLAWMSSFVHNIKKSDIKFGTL